MNDEPRLLVLWYDMLKWLLGRTEKFPRRIRFTISSRIDNLGIEIMERLAEARYVKDKAALLGEVSAKLDRLRLLLRLCHDLAHLDHKAYEYVSRQMDEAGRMLGGWLKAVGGPSS